MMLVTHNTIFQLDYLKNHKNKNIKKSFKILTDPTFKFTLITYFLHHYQIWY